MAIAAVAASTVTQQRSVPSPGRHVSGSTLISLLSLQYQQHSWQHSSSALCSAVWCGGFAGVQKGEPPAVASVTRISRGWYKGGSREL